jgi:hypothetical protein
MAKLPDEALYAKQSKAIDDSIGPVLLKADKSPARPGTTQDTLRIVVSEPIQSATNMLQILKFSASCKDKTGAQTVVSYGEPTLDPNDPTHTHYIIIVDPASAVPDVGACVFLDNGGNITDLKFNPAVARGVNLGGRDPNNAIRMMRGFPPVVGLDPSQGAYQVAVNDTRDSTNGGYVSSDGKVYWVPPVDFVNQAANIQAGGRYQPVPPDPNTTYPPDPTFLTEIPPYISAVQIISTLGYTAYISIFDNLGNFVWSSTQSFGAKNETKNVRYRAWKNPPGWLNYLVWDLKDKNGQEAAQGVYVWKVVFHFDNHKQEIRYIRTGVTRRNK